MTKRDDIPRTFELIERIGNLLRGHERDRGSELGLQAVHLQALWFIARSNRYSDTPGALAEYLGVTRGTTSSTLKVLRERGLVGVTKDPDDARVSRLSLTADGERFLRASLPPPALDEALGVLSAAQREALRDGLIALLSGLQRGSGARAFGVCHTCEHFTRESRGYRCGLTGERLERHESELICRDHSAA